MPGGRRFGTWSDQISETAREIRGQRPVKARGEVREQFKQALQCRAVEVIGFNLSFGDNARTGGCVLQKRHFSADLAWPDRRDCCLKGDLHSSRSFEQEINTIRSPASLYQHIAFLEMNADRLVGDQSPVISREINQPVFRR